MRLMTDGFQRFAPEQDTGMGLHESFPVTAYLRPTYDSPHGRIEAEDGANCMTFTPKTEPRTVLGSAFCQIKF